MRLILFLLFFTVIINNTTAQRWVVKMLDVQKLPNNTFFLKKDDRLVGIKADSIFNQISNLSTELETIKQTLANLNIEVIDNTTDKERIESLIKGKSSAEIYRMFNKTTSTKNGYSMLKICQILEIDNSGTKRTLAGRISAYGIALITNL